MARGRATSRPRRRRRTRVAVGLLSALVAGATLALLSTSAVGGHRPRGESELSTAPQLSAIAQSSGVPDGGGLTPSAPADPTPAGSGSSAGSTMSTMSPTASAAVRPPASGAPALAPMLPPAPAPGAPLPRAYGSMRGAPGVAAPLPAGEVSLTFDDGPDPRWTPAVLAVLAQYHVHATFFDIGVHAAAYPALVRAEYAQGNGVGNHTWTHPNLTLLTPAGVQDQLHLTNAALTAATGARPSCLRPPYDAIDPLVRAMVGHRRLAMMLYDIDPKDWTRPGAPVIAARVLAAIHPGAVVDLHDGGGDRSETVAALPAILQGLAARHLTPVAICR